jgi:hypothetical protein
LGLQFAGAWLHAASTQEGMRISTMNIGGGDWLTSVQGDLMLQVGCDLMYSCLLLSCLCCTLSEAAAGSIYMTYL